MDYQCGDCNAPLDEKTLDSGRCPACGARISPFGDVIRAGNSADIPNTAPVWPADIPLDPPPMSPEPPTLADSRRLPITRPDRIAIARAKPLSFHVPADTVARDRATSLGLVTGIGIAAIMVVVCTLSFITTAVNGFGGPAVASRQTVFHKVTPDATNDPNNLGFTTQVANPTALPYNYATPTLEPTTTPFGGPPTVTPSPSGQFSAGPVQCGQLGSASFILGASSDTPIPFIASANGSASVNPPAGQVSTSQPITMHVALIKPTEVTITDPTGNVPTIKVQINCV